MTERIPILEHYGPLPAPYLRLLNRSARLQRMVELDAPQVLLDVECRLVGEALLDLACWTAANVTGPYRALCEERLDLLCGS